MPDFCTCGAQLPPDARFCHKCGKPQYDYPGFTEETAAPTPPPLPVEPVQQPLDISFHNRLAVRIGFLAAVTAVLLSMFPLPFPLARLLVAFIAGGFLAVFAYSRRTGQNLSIRNGARMGWITGIFCFTFVTILFTVTMVFMVTLSNKGELAEVLKSQLPPDGVRPEQLTQALSDPATLAGTLVLSVILMFVIFTALPVLGGALASKVFAKE